MQINLMIFSYSFHLLMLFSEAVAERCTVKKVLLKISKKSQESTCVKVSSLVIIKKETPVQMFSSEFCKVFKKPFSWKVSRRLLLYFLPFL